MKLIVKEPRVEISLNSKELVALEQILNFYLPSKSPDDDERERQVQNFASTLECNCRMIREKMEGGRSCN